MKNVIRISLSFVLNILFIMTPVAVLAQPSQSEIVKKIVPEGTLPDTKADDATIENVLSTIFGALALISIVFITIGGLRYVISEGNEQKVQQAKETVLYAIIGLVISLVAFSVVRFVLGNIV